MRVKTPEGKIKRELVDYLNTLGAVVEPLYTGMTRAPGGYYRTPKSSLGRPDILMLYKSQAIAIEVKADTKQRNSQMDWQVSWESNGGIYWIVSSLDTLQANLSLLAAR
jgi:hypothetical protein